MIRVPLGKGCLLVLTQSEYLRALARGKACRRAEALTRRVAGESKHSTITVAP